MILLPLLFTTCLSSEIFTVEFAEVITSKKLIPCEMGWHVNGDYCYKLEGSMLEDERSWTEASSRCYQLGGSLASVHSEDENEFLTNLLLQEANLFTWIGLNDIEVESQFLWEDGSLFNYENWATGEPSGEKFGDEDCVGLSFEPLLGRVGNWNDANCEQSHPYICRKSRIPDMMEPNPSYQSGLSKFFHSITPNPKRKSTRKNKHAKAATYENLHSLLKVSENIAVGNLAFLTDEQSLLVRVEEGWKHVRMGKLIPLPPPVTVVPITRAPSNDLPVNTEEFETIHRVSTISASFNEIPVDTEKFEKNRGIRMVALNQPLTGYMNGIRSVDNECNRQANNVGLKGNYLSFLAGRHRNLSDIVKKESFHLPVVNLKGNLLFSSWKDIFDGMGGLILENIEIYSFEGKNVLEDVNWPNKMLWHGSNFFGTPALEFHCEFWQSGSSDMAGMSSYIDKVLLLDQIIHTCNELFIVLCIEATNQEVITK